MWFFAFTELIANDAFNKHHIITTVLLKALSID